MYGTQAYGLKIATKYLFENDVKMYGTQANILNGRMIQKFENDVKCMILRQNKQCAENLSV